MASHTEINVSDTNWVVRIEGKDVQVKVLEKIKKASGRGYEFRCKRIGPDGRVTGRNITKGSGAFRRPGEAPRTTGFSKAKKKTTRAKRNARTTSRPPASAFFSEVREPGASKASRSAGNGKSSGLGSLRGRGRATSATSSPARPSAPSTSGARREIEKQLKHAGLSALASQLVSELIRCDGTEYSIQQIYGRVMADHRMRSFGASFRR